MYNNIYIKYERKSRTPSSMLIIWSVTYVKAHALTPGKLDRLRDVVRYSARRISNKVSYLRQPGYFGKNI